MDSALIGNMLKMLGIGGGSAGVVLAAFMVWGYLKIKAHNKDINGVKEHCNKQDDGLELHGRVLTKLEANQTHLINGQETMFKKVDKLIDMHLEKG